MFFERMDHFEFLSLDTVVVSSTSGLYSFSFSLYITPIYELQDDQHTALIMNLTYLSKEVLIYKIFTIDISLFTIIIFYNKHS